MQMSDVYSLWSGTNTVQMMSVHTKDTKEMAKYQSLGQKARFMYGHRPKHDKEDTYGDTEFRVLIELHKQFTSMHRCVVKATPEHGEQLQQHISHMDHMTAEVARLIPKLPSHKQMGRQQPEECTLWQRPFMR